MLHSAVGVETMPDSLTRETIGQTVLRLRDEPVVQKRPEAWVPTPTVMTAMGQLMDLVAEVRSPQGGWPADRPPTAENLTPYVLDEAYDLLVALQQSHQPEQQAPWQPFHALQQLLQRRLLVVDAIPHLLWTIARSSPQAMKLLAGLRAEIFQPGQTWERGVLRLVALLELRTPHLHWTLDLATLEPPPPELQTNTVVSWSDNRIHWVEGFLQGLYNQLQEKTPLVKPLLQTPTAVEVLVPGQSWETGFLQVQLQLTFSADTLYLPVVPLSTALGQPTVLEAIVKGIEGSRWDSRGTRSLQAGADRGAEPQGSGPNAAPQSLAQATPPAVSQSSPQSPPVTVESPIAAQTAGIAADAVDFTLNLPVPTPQRTVAAVIAPPVSTVEAEGFGADGLAPDIGATWEAEPAIEPAIEPAFDAAIDPALETGPPTALSLFGESEEPLADQLSSQLGGQLGSQLGGQLANPSQTQSGDRKLDRPQQDPNADRVGKAVTTPNSELASLTVDRFGDLFEDIPAWDAPIEAAVVETQALTPAIAFDRSPSPDPDPEEDLASLTLAQAADLFPSWQEAPVRDPALTEGSAPSEDFLAALIASPDLFGSNAFDLETGAEPIANPIAGSIADPETVPEPIADPLTEPITAAVAETLAEPVTGAILEVVPVDADTRELADFLQATGVTSLEDLHLDLHSAHPALPRSTLIYHQLQQAKAQNWGLELLDRAGENSTTAEKLLPSLVQLACETLDPPLTQQTLVDWGFLPAESDLEALALQLLWQLIHHSYPLTCLLSGVPGQILQPQWGWENGMIYLVPLLRLQSDGLCFDLDLTSGSPVQVETLLIAPDILLQTNTTEWPQVRETVGQFQAGLQRKLQCVIPELSLLFQGMTVKFRNCQQRWRLGQLQLRLELSFQDRWPQQAR